MKRCFSGLLIAALMLAVAAPAFAQGGGASSTGYNSGSRDGRAGRRAARCDRHRDEPVAARPADAVTSETGNYRFPAVPPGTYTLTTSSRASITVQPRGHLRSRWVSRPT